MKFTLFALVALAAVLAMTDAQDCELTTTGDEWKEACNWCRCISGGFGVCTRMGCDGYVRSADEQVCKGNAKWKVDCNWCTCVNGQPDCSTTDCTTTSEASPPLVRTDTLEGECVALSKVASFLRVCNWCTCSSKGLAQCTRKFCRPSAGEKSAHTLQCTGKIRWKEDCNLCECVDGIKVCSGETCPGEESSGPVLRGNAVCKVATGRGRWMQQCNWCLCSSGRGHCTKKGCLPEKQSSTATRSNPACEGSVTWKEGECNWCRCVEGRGICTDWVCESEVVKSQAAAPPAEKEQGECSEGQSWVQDCNACMCNNGRAFCTRRACLDSARFNAAMEVTKMSSELDSADCKNGSSWMQDCNQCSCLETKAVCTEIACPPGWENGDTQETSGPLCEENSVWRDDCNTCSCFGGVPLCTKKGCNVYIPFAGVSRSGSSPSILGTPQLEDECTGEDCDSGSPPTPSPQVEEPMCTNGSRWWKQCNSCSCTEAGVAICEQKACLSTAAEEMDGTCEGNSSWNPDNCNWCNCINGRGACTLMSCLPEERSSISLAQDSCFSGNKWTENCNVCFCANSIAVCTKKLCLPQNSINLPARTNVCAEGDSWTEDCNSCRCVKGESACTRRGCLPAPLRVDDSVEMPPLCSASAISPGAKLCGGFETKWTYNLDQGACEEIVYGGCGGSQNLFPSEDECSTTCSLPSPTIKTAKVLDQADERCFQDVMQGPCFGHMGRYAFNDRDGRCEMFFYGGCQGNQNNFQTMDECVEVCGGKPPVVELNCDRSKCNWKRFEHYIAKECEPVYEGGSCCPTSFACTTEEEQGKSPDSCYYKRKEYKNRESVPVEHDCSTNCYCRKSSQGDRKPNIVCANIECPSVHVPLEPGCREIHTPGQCCSTEKECVNRESPAELQPRNEPLCTWNGKPYQFGDRMYFDEAPCQVCICTPDFTNPLEIGCHRVDCGFEFRYRSEMNAGCTPIFFEDSCCSWDWICPDDERLLEVIETHPQRVREAECTLGNLTVALGNSVQMSDCHFKCRCQTPPELTCTKYRSCEMAQQSDDNVVCPEVDCPASCNFEVDSSTGCPKCFCSYLNYTCPMPPTCPPACRNPTIGFDESTGCPACECECSTDLIGKPHCPMDCAIIMFFNEDTGCMVCECDPKNTRTPWD